MIKITHLTKQYGDRLAVNDVSLELPSGKIIGFLGPNGAGKSTTMNMITGFLAPSQGNILIDDISMLKQPLKAKKKIGYLPENPPLYVDMTVDEYLTFVIELKQIPKGERKKELERIIELTKLMGVRERLIRNLSKGYRQRVGLAQTLVGNPSMLILDEPTVGLDPKQIVEIRELIRMLGKSHTIILSTHILTEAQAVCDEIVIISRGQIVAYDTPDNLVKDYNKSPELEIAVKGNSSGVEDILGKMEGVTSFKILQEESGQTRVLLYASCDIREKLVTTFFEKHMTLLELNVHKVSLEDVYLKLTNDTYLDTITLQDMDEEQE